MSNKLFKKGLKADFIQLASKSENTIYFCTDTRELYIGSVLYAEPIRIYSGSLPTTAAMGVLYFNESTGAAYRYNGTAWVTIIKPSVTVIDETASHDTTPSTLAVKDYVDEAFDDIVNSEDTVVGIESKAGSNGTVQVIKGDNSREDVPLTGVAHDITYDSTNLKITIPMVGKSDLVISFPEDNFVESGVYNTNTKEIELTMKSEDIIKIPASHLVDIYTSGSVSTDTIFIAVDSNNKITASIKVDTSGALNIGADGKLTIDLSPYVTTSVLDSKIGDISGGTIKNYVDTTIQSAVEDVLGDITAVTSGIEQRTDSIEEVLTWGSF